MPTQDVSFADFFAELPDPRVDRTKQHRLLEFLAITVCATIAGADTWEEVEQFGRAKHAWLRRFLALPHVILSHDTFNQVFAALDPQRLGDAVAERTPGRQGRTPARAVRPMAALGGRLDRAHGAEFHGRR
jgi:hypothetical protein